MSTARCTRKPPRRSIWIFFFNPPPTTTSPKVPPDLFLPFSPLQTFPKRGTPLRGRGVNLSYKGSHSFEGSLNFSCNLIPARLAACISPRGASPRYNLWRIIAGGSPFYTGWVVISLQCSNHKGSAVENIRRAREPHKQRTDGSYGHTEASV